MVAPNHERRANVAADYVPPDVEDRDALARMGKRAQAARSAAERDLAARVRKAERDLKRYLTADEWQSYPALAREACRQLAARVASGAIPVSDRHLADVVKALAETARLEEGRPTEIRGTVAVNATADDVRRMLDGDEAPRNLGAGAPPDPLLTRPIDLSATLRDGSQ
jgi:hypothetical protein